MTPLDAYLRQAGIKHFRASEVVHVGKGFPTESMWPHILGALRLADKIREAWGAPVRVVSGYRSPEYNAKIGGSKKSMHMEFRALDLRPAAGDMSKFIGLCANLVHEERKAGVNVGFGTYDTFVHIDTGAGTGRNRTWDERRDKSAGR
jgi:uncharacterized protein YcbK (DUF882 family)